MYAFCIFISSYKQICDTVVSDGDPKLVSKAEKGEVSSPDVSGLEDSDHEADVGKGQHSPPVTSTPYTAPKRDDERMSVASSVRYSGARIIRTKIRKHILRVR